MSALLRLETWLVVIRNRKRARISTIWTHNKYFALVSSVPWSWERSAFCFRCSNDTHGFISHWHPMLSQNLPSPEIGPVGFLFVEAKFGKCRNGNVPGCSVSTDHLMFLNVHLLPTIFD
jgi:hypothetical protein